MTSECLQNFFCSADYVISLMKYSKKPSIDTNPSKIVTHCSLNNNIFFLIFNLFINVQT
jgi:hypothetical protein